MRYVVLISCLALALQAAAQGNRFNFVNYNSDNGLSSNDVNAILKDRLGFMWFATDDGLNKFDGTRFTVYNHNAQDTSSIIANQIITLYQDPAGSLWAGTNKGLSLYDRKRDCFHNFDVTKGMLIRSICSDKAGNLWIASYAGLVRFNPSTGHINCYDINSTRQGSLPSNILTSVFIDSRHRLWVGSNKGLFLYQPGTDNFTRISNDVSNPSAISDSVVKAIAEDESGRVWFGTNNGGINLLETDGLTFKKFKNNKLDDSSISSNRIYCVVPEKNGKLWIGTEQGINIFDIKTGKAQRVEPDLRNKFALQGKSVRSIFIDSGGIYWFGTIQGGVNKFDKNLTFFNLVQSNPFDPLGLSDPKVTSFAQGNNGDIYVGTDGGGLNLYHRKTGLFEHLNLEKNNGTSSLSVLALERAENELWVGTYLQGVYLLNLTNNNVRHIRKGNGPGEISSSDIFCLKKDKHGNIWVGSNGQGVFEYDAKLGIFRRFDNVIPDGPSSKLFTNGYIRAIEEDSAGNILIGALGSGIASYNPAKRTFRIFNHSNTRLPLEDVQTIHVSRNGTIWVGTQGGGLCKLDDKNNCFTEFTEAQGLANAVLYKILEDDAGKLWVSTNKGISRLNNPEHPGFKNYTFHNGLQPSSFNLGAGLKAADGELFFGGLEGFNHFSPLKLKENRNVPTVVFTDLKVANRIVIPGNEANINEHISVATEIRVDYKQNFSVDFAALDYTTAQETQYMYKLDGFDKSWNHVGFSRTAVFTNLYPGGYTLEVKAKNCNGSWITPAAKIKIYVKPPFWLTGYAYALYIFATGMVLWGFRYRGIQKLKNKFALEQESLKMKQAVEQERLQAERLHEFDQARIRFLTNLSHEFRTPISLIMGPIEQLQQMEGNPEKQDKLTMAKRNGRRLLNLVNQLLDFRKLEEHELKLNNSEGEIVSFIKEVADSFRDMAHRKHINFDFQTAIDQYYTLFDRDKIERILFNLLGNAFKFTAQNGKVTLCIQQASTKGLCITVSDNGIGMFPDEQQHIFDRFFQGKGHGSLINQGSGIGLSITKEFVELHGGNIEVASTPGEGSVFTVKLPLENIYSLEEEAQLVEGYNEDEIKLAEETQNEVAACEMLTVLLVEDNDDFRSYLRDSLKHCFKVVEAPDGRAGWQKALSAHPDVIVSDISMPHIGGIELSQKIKSDKRTSHIPVMLLTALTGDAYQLKGLETGASDYLTKPFSAEILKIKIRNLAALNQNFKETYTRRLTIDTPEAEVQSDDEKLLLEITQYIESALEGEQLSVEELSKHVFMSRSSLYRKIVDLTGETPVEFIRSVKLNKAAELLEKSDLSVSEVGYAVGFTTPNYFARAFKAKFNMRPSEYASLKKSLVA